MNLFKKQYVIRRYGDGTYINGYYQASITDMVVWLNVQPDTTKTEILPEGERAYQKLKSWGSDVLRTVDQYSEQKADRLCYDGKWYICQTSNKWDASMPTDHYQSGWVELPEKKQEDPITPEEVIAH